MKRALRFRSSGMSMTEKRYRDHGSTRSCSSVRYIGCRRKLISLRPEVIVSIQAAARDSLLSSSMVWYEDRGAILKKYVARPELSEDVASTATALPCGPRMGIANQMYTSSIKDRLIPIRPCPCGRAT